MENRHYKKSCKRLKGCGIIQPFFKDLLRTIPKQMVQQKAVQDYMGQLRTIEDWIGGEAQM